MSAPNSTDPSRTSTPNLRFASSSKTAEDLLANQTVGLVNLSDFRKRRAEAIEQKERDAQDALLPPPRASTGTTTPASDG
jgi:protein FAM50